ncbi:MAG TPA: flagellar basal body-associated FliL family protein [Verrucomicrobiae bacterium]|jgi:flagellar FliL protein|nr:flagellar basal body-associated FliL family protein [Verrucomicrobiae bacterium]
MADRTAEARNGRQEEAAAEETPSAPAAAAPASNPWIPLIITAVVMPALAFATTRYVLVPQMKQALTKSMAAAPADTTGAATAATPSAPEGKVKITVQMNKILVNVAGTMGTRYLMTSVTLVGTDPSFKDKIELNRDQLLDLATGALSTKTIADIEKPDSRNVIRAELLEVFNNALGSPLVKEIYLTELAIQ